MKNSAIFLPLLLLIILGLRLEQSIHKASKYIKGQSVTVDSFLLSEPTISGNRQVFFISSSDNTQLTVIAPVFPAFHYGDFVRVSGTIKQRVLGNEKIVNSIYFPTVEARDFDQNVPFGVIKTLFVLSRGLRDHFVSLFQQTLPSQEANLLVGIVLGVKEPLPQKFTQDLRNAGVFHVVAASGMNVTLVAGFFTVILAPFLRRHVVLMLSIVGIWFYAAISGFQPSIVRASMMGSVVFLSQLLGRQNMPFYSLSITALVMLIVAPTLYSDVGFELSFASTLGLVLLSPLQKLKMFGRLGSMGEDVATTLSAQMATLPILLANFGTYSLWSVLINGLVLWTVAPLMVLGGVAGLLGIILSPIGGMLTWLCLPFLFYFETVVGIFGRLTSPLTVETMPLTVIIGYYFLLTAFILWLRSRVVDEESDL